MDGLTIRNTEGLIETGQTMSQLQESRLKSKIGGEMGANSISSDNVVGDFASTFKNAINEVNKLQKVADTKMEQLATGKAKNIPEVMVAAEKADIALKLMVQVRNKMIEAYQEVMRMQV